MEKFAGNIAEHLKKLNLRLWQKKPSRYGKRNNHRIAVLITALFAALIGTYLDLIFAGKQMYAFPKRPFPDIFTVNIAFTLIILPICIVIFLEIAKNLRTLQTIVLTLFLGLLVSVTEHASEQSGFFTHSHAWHHAYSFFGYILFMLLIYRIYRWFL
ncbi:CBO0543 family protein [Scopulibacillus darangshiensis]|uniref:CBO0543 family protein n=1 Tax=Scopulibacillus darangshiensis TaxID=442528 RepID=UPI003C763A76